MDEFDSYVRAWRDRWKRERKGADQEARRARTVARRIARLLARRYGARRVLLCGSLARGDFRKGSDIDLAVEGLDEERFFEAGAAAARRAGDIGLDLVPLEDATPRYRKWVEREGVLLHDQKRA